MTKFQDGPANGVVLLLRRSPLFLRVVHAEGSEAWDALDRTEDILKRNESVYVYKRIGQACRVHLNLGRKGGSGYYALVDYAWAEPQPDEGTMRDTEAWRAWAPAEYKKTKPAKA